MGACYLLYRLLSEKVEVFFVTYDTVHYFGPDGYATAALTDTRKLATDNAACEILQRSWVIIDNDHFHTLPPPEWAMQSNHAVWTSSPSRQRFKTAESGYDVYYITAWSWDEIAAVECVLFL